MQQAYFYTTAKQLQHHQLLIYNLRELCAMWHSYWPQVPPECDSLEFIGFTFYAQKQTFNRICFYKSIVLRIWTSNLLILSARSVHAVKASSYLHGVGSVIESLWFSKQEQL